MWYAVIGFNLNTLLKLLFHSLLTINNNISLKIYCENIVYITFLKETHSYIFGLLTNNRKGHIGNEKKTKSLQYE